MSPSLACEAPLDLSIKSRMLGDMFTLAGIQPYDNRKLSSLAASKSKPSKTVKKETDEERVVRELTAEEKRRGDWERVKIPRTKCHIPVEKFFSRETSRTSAGAKLGVACFAAHWIVTRRTQRCGAARMKRKSRDEKGYTSPPGRIREQMVSTPSGNRAAKTKAAAGQKKSFGARYACARR